MCWSGWRTPRRSTRTGANGVAQVDTEGLIAAAFTHRDSRAGDPDLHTHVAVSNKVSHVDANGVRRWLALDGQPLHRVTVAASELYNTRLEAHMIASLRVRFVEKARGRGKRPVCVVGHALPEVVAHGSRIHVRGESDGHVCRHRGGGQKSFDVYAAKPEAKSSSSKRGALLNALCVFQGCRCRAP